MRNKFMNDQQALRSRWQLVGDCDRRRNRFLRHAALRLGAQPKVKFFRIAFENRAGFAPEEKDVVASAGNWFSARRKQPQDFAIGWPPTVARFQANGGKPRGVRQPLDFVRGVFAVVAVGGRPRSLAISVY